ncbi:hypothetical protein GCM10010913_30120 [Paenibacillus aceti]|uniref:Uncharacterized protein n=1 Tax=Paenibacillus aceti TaxID=1820010 RepID=A0ABQ1VYX7_9BACL|nr:hypothetical protein GCM10010913_30120 [Paenibacillus aceti]
MVTHDAACRSRSSLHVYMGESGNRGVIGKYFWKVAMDLLDFVKG